MRRLLWWIICGTKGGVTRARILESLKMEPSNANRLAESLELDYKTIRHHIDVLLKNQLITATGNGYGTSYSLSDVMEANINELREICNHLGKTRYRGKIGLFHGVINKKGSNEDGNDDGK